MTQGPRLDPYAVLGVPRGATSLEIARAHRRLAKRYHPDLHPEVGGADRMRRVNAAWRLLSNPAARAAYDLEHPAGSAGTGGHWVPPPAIRPFRTEEATTVRSWASWRTTAEETRRAPSTRRSWGEVVEPATRRPRPMVPPERTFRDSGVAAILVAALILLLLLAVVVAGKMA